MTLMSRSLTMLAVALGVVVLALVTMSDESGFAAGSREGVRSSASASAGSSCAFRATHPRAKSLSSKFILNKQHFDDRWVKTQATMRDLTGCPGQYVWKAQIRKENEHGYYNGSGRITIGRGNTERTLNRVINTKGGISCDGSVHPQDGIYDAYQLNWFIYNDAGHKTIRRVRSTVFPYFRYC